MAFSVGSITGLTTKTGIGGLASGMSTDELIEKMTALSRQRITQQEQSVQKLLWKQDAYRSVTKSLMEFRTKYLDILSPTNFKSSSLFSTIRASVDESVTAFTATAAAGAASGSMYVNKIEQLATSYTYTSADAVSKPLEGSFDAAAALAAMDVDDIKAGNSFRTFSVTLDGQQKTIFINKEFFEAADAHVAATPGATDFDGVQYALQNAMDLAFNGKSTADLEAADPTLATRRVTVNYEDASGGQGYVKFSTAASSRLTVNATSSSSRDLQTLELFGLSDGQSNRLNLDTELKNLGSSLAGGLAAPANGDGKYIFNINGAIIEARETESLRSLMDKVNSSKAGVTMSYSELTDKFTITAKETGSAATHYIAETTGGGNIMAALGLGNQAGSNTVFTAGQNAVAYINGQRVERSTNDFTVDNVRFSLKETYDPNSYVPGTSANTTGAEISLRSDPDDLFNAIKGFVEDYNTMIDFMKNLTKEKAYSDYEPLTDAQRAEMTEGQIKQWEEKAKSGILLNDSLVNKIANNLQNTLLSTVNGFGLFSLGIQSSGWQDNGKLKIADESALKEILNTRSDEVRNLFTNATNGIAVKMDKILDDAVKTNGVQGARGSLVEMAGYLGTRSDTENTINDQISSYNTRIDSFKLQLQQEESRLWAQFTAMETALSKLNNQNSILSQYLGSAQQ
jgi:flagellar hook-associated protein 2